MARSKVTFHPEFDGVPDLDRQPEASGLNKHIAFVGAGAVGGFVSGNLARAGQDVTLIEAWPEHVGVVKKRHPYHDAGAVAAGTGSRASHRRGADAASTADRLAAGAVVFVKLGLNGLYHEYSPASDFV
jgi:2-polyprenyl-6-methoxyphenol hydroxylase-like FAD-dependent oxidoreductase